MRSNQCLSTMNDLFNGWPLVTMQRMQNVAVIAFAAAILHRTGDSVEACAKAKEVRDSLFQ